MTTVAKNVVLKDSDGTELYPQTTVAQVKGDYFSHNCFVRGKDITSYYKDGSLWDRIAGTNGYESFEDLYLGDYFTLNSTIVNTNNTEKSGMDVVTIAGFNIKLGNNNDTSLPYHILVIPGQYVPGILGTQTMNDEEVTTGGYAGSRLHNSIYGADSNNNAVTTIEGTINYQLYKEFGTHLQKTWEHLTNQVVSSRYNRFGTASGGSVSSKWYECYAVNMTEAEVYGTTVWSSSGCDTGTIRGRLPLFALTEGGSVDAEQTGYWLRDVASAKYFCCVGPDGEAGWQSASEPDLGICPCFCLA